MERKERGPERAREGKGDGGGLRRGEGYEERGGIHPLA